MRPREPGGTMTTPSGPGHGRPDPGLSAIMSERRQLINLAYRLLSSLAEAEDAVQETYARWYAMSGQQRQAIESPGGAARERPARSRSPSQTHNGVIGAPPATRLAGTSRAPSRRSACPDLWDRAGVVTFRGSGSGS